MSRAVCSLLTRPQQTQEAIEKGIAQQKETAVIAGLVLGSPEFQRR